MIGRLGSLSLAVEWRQRVERVAPGPRVHPAESFCPTPSPFCTTFIHSLAFINIKGQPDSSGGAGERTGTGTGEPHCHLVTTLMGSDQVCLTRAREGNELAESLHDSVPPPPQLWLCPPAPPSPSVWVSRHRERTHSTQFIGLH